MSRPAISSIAAWPERRAGLGNRRSAIGSRQETGLRPLTSGLRVPASDLWLLFANILSVLYGCRRRANVRRTSLGILYS